MFALLNKTKRQSKNELRNLCDEEDILDSLSDTGLLRSKNEDSVITITHPENANLKLLAVADGIGGRCDGEIASNFTIDVLKQWFQKEEQFKINDTYYLSSRLTTVIKYINNCLYFGKSYRSGCGTTLTCAIINEANTVIANIGDSRAYTVKKDVIEQITRDDSVVWYYYEQGDLTKEEIRCHKNNSLITKCLGPDFGITPDITILENDSYDGILLFTDGVTDCLPDSKIEKIIHSNKKSLAQAIIKEAVYGKPTKRIPKGEDFYQPKNGKDNATVALYFKANQYS